MSVTPSVTVVVPCFNEADRMVPEEFLAMTEHPGVSVLFVDDGSGDDTPVVLATATQGHLAANVLTLGENVGKAEAVRAGMRQAIASGATITGYLDADGATAPAEWLRLVGVLTSTEVDAILGSRVAMLGYVVRRRRVRHYSGRVFATLAAVALGIPVYDTQCGAKVFLVTPRLVRALDAPFRTRWAFDVELLQRLLGPASATDHTAPAVVREEPLRLWADRPGSTLSPWAALCAVVDLLRLTATRIRTS